MMKFNIRQYLETHKHLPKFMRDFHDQKDLFKTIEESIDWNKRKDYNKISWVDAHIYVIDIFYGLWLGMGTHCKKAARKLILTILIAKLIGIIRHA